jgi:hypothetical protein
MSKKKRLDDLIDYLERLLDFLEPFKQLLNTHNVQFLVDDFWSNEKLFEKQLRLDLEDFIVANERVSNLNEEQREFNVNLIKFYHQFSLANDGSSNGTPSTCLEQLFMKIIKLKNEWNQTILTSLNSLTRSELNASREFEKRFDLMQKQNRFMNEKKVHEVDIMSKFVATMCKNQEIETVNLYNLN